MKSIEEIRAQRDAIKIKANDPTFREQALAQNLCHTLTWILDDQDGVTLPPSDLFGWVTTSVAELAARVSTPSPEAILSEIDKMAIEQGVSQ